MPLQFKNIAVGNLQDDVSGNNYAANKAVYILNLNNTLAQIYSDEAGATPIVQDGVNNVTGAKGVFGFWVEAGDYFVQVGANKYRVSITGADYFNSRVDETVNLIVDSVAGRGAYYVVGSFEAGFTYTDINQVGTFGGANYYVYTGGLTNLPHIVTAGTDPTLNSDYAQVFYGEIDNVQGLRDELDHRVVVYKSSVGKSAFDNMLDGVITELGVGDKCSTGGTAWKVVDYDTGIQSNYNNSLYFKPLTKINVQDFGALGIGADYTAELQQAASYGYPLKIPKTKVLGVDGVYGLSGQVLLKSSIDGGDALIEYTYPTTTGTYESGCAFLFKDTEKCRAENLNLKFVGDYNPGGANGYVGRASAIGVSGSSKIKILKNNIEGFNASGVYLSMTSTTDNMSIIISHNNIDTCRISGIWGFKSKGVTVIGNTVENCGLDGFGNTGYGISLGENGDPINNVTITGNTVRNCYRKAIDVHGGTDLSITANVCDDCKLYGIYAVYALTDGGAESVVSRAIVTGNTVNFSGFTPNDPNYQVQRGIEVGVFETNTPTSIGVPFIVTSNAVSGMNFNQGICYSYFTEGYCDITFDDNSISNIILARLAFRNLSSTGEGCSVSISETKMKRVTGIETFVYDQHTEDLTICDNNPDCPSANATGTKRYIYTPIAAGKTRNIDVSDNKSKAASEAIFFDSGIANYAGDGSIRLRDNYLSDKSPLRRFDSSLEKILPTDNPPVQRPLMGEGATYIRSVDANDWNGAATAGQAKLTFEKIDANYVRQELIGLVNPNERFYRQGGGNFWDSWTVF